MSYRTAGLLCLVLGVSHVFALTGTNYLSCSTVDEDGYRYFPDYPVDKHHLSGATNLTLRQALRIYSLTPNCSGTIVGADFCFHYQNVSSNIHNRVVFRLYEYKREGDNFVPKNNNSVRVLQAFPIDRTRCTAAAATLEGLLCCYRMTFFGNGPIPFTNGEELVFTLFAQIQPDEYPLLQYKTTRSEFQLRTFEVDTRTLPVGSDVSDNVYGPRNTREEMATFPIARLVVEPNVNDTTEKNEARSANPCSDQPSLIGSFSATIAIVVIVSTVLLVGLTIAIKLRSKQKTKSTTRRKESTRRSTDVVIDNRAYSPPPANREHLHWHPRPNTPRRKTEPFYDDITDTVGTPATQQQF